MKIALLGHGKMGQLIDQLAPQKGHTVVAIQTESEKASKDKLKQADVFIDFSHPNAVLENTKMAISLHKPLVIGTTGWDIHHDKVFDIIRKSSIGCIHSANFSLGIALYKSIMKHIATLMPYCEEYDIAGIEMHHNTKVDSPSGTAKSIQEILLKEGNRQVTFSSIRCGSLPGTHEIIMDSPFDTLTFIHEAKSRHGFALGAIKAAEWIIGRKGLYTMEDLCRLD